MGSYWWLEVPSDIPHGTPLREGATVRVETLVRTPQEWTSQTPPGTIGSVSDMWPIQAEDVEGAWHPSRLHEPTPSQFTSSNLDEQIEAALDCIPPDWPVYEVMGARATEAGWHTLIRTLRPVTGESAWRGSLPAELVRVEPWLMT